MFKVSNHLFSLTILLLSILVVKYILGTFLRISIKNNLQKKPREHYVSDKEQCLSNAYAI